MKKILFLCKNNSAGSQIAEAYAKMYAPAGTQIASAGLDAEEIHPLAVRVMSEAGIDISKQNAKQLADIPIDAFDIIIALCREANEKCPARDGNACLISWDIPSPAFPLDAPDREIDAFRNLRDLIHSLVKDFFTRGYYKAFALLNSRLDAVMNNFLDGLLLHDNNRTISLFNRAAERITGWRAEEVVGRDCREVFPHGICGKKCNFCSTELQRFQHLVYPIEFTSRDGVKKSITMSVMPTFDETGKHSGVIAMFKDISRIVELEMRVSDGKPFPGIISTDKEMQTVFSLIRDIKGSDAPVLIQGETGTGKDLVSHAIHKESRRAQGHFVPVNCGALPQGTIESELFGHVKGAFTGAVRDKKGRFELADGGTIFLDEVAELSPHMQVKLLRVLQDGTFERVGGEQTIKANFRVISATNRDLRHMIKTGAFREDLFYRLCVVPIHLPPLRARKNDIFLVAEYFLERQAREAGRAPLTLADDSKRIFMDYHWPGNVRQLQNALQYAALKCKGDTIEPRHLPPEIASRDIPANRQKQGPGRKRLLTAGSVAAALKEAGGNRAKAARTLGVNRATLYRFLETSSLD